MGEWTTPQAMNIKVGCNVYHPGTGGHSDWLAYWCDGTAESDYCRVVCRGIDERQTSLGWEQNGWIEEIPGVAIE